MQSTIKTKHITALRGYIACAIQYFNCVGTWFRNFSPAGVKGRWGKECELDDIVLGSVNKTLTSESSLSLFVDELIVSTPGFCRD